MRAARAADVFSVRRRLAMFKRPSQQYGGPEEKHNFCGDEKILSVGVYIAHRRGSINGNREPYAVKFA